MRSEQIFVTIREWFRVFGCKSTLTPYGSAVIEVPLIDPCLEQRPLRVESGQSYAAYQLFDHAQKQSNPQLVGDFHVNGDW